MSAEAQRSPKGDISEEVIKNIIGTTDKTSLIISALDSNGKVIKADLRAVDQQLQSVLKKSISGGATVVTTTSAVPDSTTQTTAPKLVPKPKLSGSNLLQVTLVSKPSAGKAPGSYQAVFPNVTVVKKPRVESENVNGSKLIEIKPLCSTTTVPISLSSNLTITKTSVIKGKEEPSSLITLEKKKTSILNPTLQSLKRGNLIKATNKEPVQIVLNSYGSSKVIRLGDDKKAKNGQQQSLLKAANEKREKEMIAAPKTPPGANGMQQSLLKQKKIEANQGSPRTQRSKSLTVFKGQAQVVDLTRSRKLSASSEGDVQALNAEAAEKAFKSNAIGEPKKKISTSSKTLLFCDEKIDEIPSSSSEPSDSLVIDEGNEEEERTQTNVSDIPENSPAHLLDWENGVGQIKGLKINFRLNEFGLLEVDEECPARHRLDIGYEKPIGERESIVQSIDDAASTYECKGCLKKGVPQDFLAPSYCSQECIKRAWKLRRNRLANGSVKRNRRKVDMKNAVRVPMPSSVMTIQRRKIFNWPDYISESSSEPAWVNLFLNPFPSGPNEFHVGMKLEAIDPENSSLFCVCTIVDIRGFRLKLNFDGYSSRYDFWVNADSMDIFPPGWCAKTNRTLTPPRGFDMLTFNWPAYLTSKRSTPAPRHLFTHLNSSSNNNPFKVGMKLEADDIRNSRKTCVATIIDLLDNRILIHFDGWDSAYDYWVDINSPYIHPVNWHRRYGFTLETPPDWRDTFVWGDYLKKTNSEPAIDRYFHARDPMNFRRGMKLEVVDKKNPQLIRAASVVAVEEYEVKLLFEGWNDPYAFWVSDDSPDIHPINWCTITGHELEAPIGYEMGQIIMPCPMPGCRGIGNAKRHDIDFHANAESCPYEYHNWISDTEKPNRLEENVPIPLIPKPNKRKSSNTATLDYESLVLKNAKMELLHSDEEPEAELVRCSPPPPKKASECAIAQELLCDYGPRLEQNFEIFMANSSNLAASFGDIRKSPLQWSTKETSEFVWKITKNQEYADTFALEEIDGAGFLSMRQSDLTDILNFKLGPSVKLYSAIVRLRVLALRHFKDTITY